MKSATKSNAFGALLAASFSVCALPLHAQQNTSQNAPDISIPAPKLPSPNGWDFFVKAGNAIRDIQSGIGSTRELPPDPAKALAQSRAYVAANQEAIRLLHEGFKYPVSATLRTYDYTDPRMMNYMTVSSLGWLLSQKAFVETQDGDFSAALNSSLDAVQLGVSMVRGGPMMPMLVGTDIEGMGRRKILALQDKLDANQARAARQRLEQIEAMRVPFSEVMLEEKWTYLTMMHPGEKMDDHQAENPSADQLKKSGLKSKEEYARWKQEQNRQGFLELISTLDIAIANAKLPYDASKLPFHKTFHKANDVMENLESGARFNYEASRTKNNFLIASLALRAFQVEHNALPETLNELLPQDLQQIPVDPFSPDGSSLRYKRDGEKYILYSVGPDAKDDGGAPIDDPKRGKSRSIPTPESRGDIVAGVNK